MYIIVTEHTVTVFWPQQPAVDPDPYPGLTLTHNAGTGKAGVRVRVGPEWP
jgi:hypothetical protein